MLLDDFVTGVRRRVRVDSECGDAELLPHRLPHERAEHGHALDVVDAKHLHGTIGADAPGAGLVGSDAISR